MGEMTHEDDARPLPSSGPLSQEVARWYVDHTDGRFLASPGSDGWWHLYDRDGAPTGDPAPVADGSATLTRRSTTSVVVILTHPGDVHAAAVREHLDTRGVPVRQVDAAAVGTMHAPVTAHVRDGVMAGSIAGVSLADVIGAWHRRPSEFPADDPGDAAEWRAGAGGVLAWMPYLNHPADMAVAGLKSYQLMTAAQCGLHVPETIITNVDPVATAFARRSDGNVVVKTMARLTARRVTADDRSGWQRPMHLTQQRINTTSHVRLTVVDGTMFAVQIDSPHLDWRDDMEQCRYQPIATPDAVAGAVRLLLSRLRLGYAAIDFALDNANRWWFLEVNPNGQWLWIEHETGLPIAAAIATALSSGRLGATARPATP